MKKTGRGYTVATIKKIESWKPGNYGENIIINILENTVLFFCLGGYYITF